MAFNNWSEQSLSQQDTGSQACPPQLPQATSSELDGQCSSRAAPLGVDVTRLGLTRCTTMLSLCCFGQGPTIFSSAPNPRGQARVPAQCPVASRQGAWCAPGAGSLVLHILVPFSVAPQSTTAGSARGGWACIAPFPGRDPSATWRPCCMCQVGFVAVPMPTAHAEGSTDLVSLLLKCFLILLSR